MLHPGTPSKLVDVEGTKDERRLINANLRDRQKQLARLRDAPVQYREPERKTDS